MPMNREKLEQVRSLVDELMSEAGAAAEPGAQSGLVCEGMGNDDIAGAGGMAALRMAAAVAAKPTVDRFESTTHQSSRNGADIDHIVIHYTTSQNIDGTINHFKNGTPRTSAHYIVGRDGELVQMVNDSDRSWHAGNSAMNARSIGIEHVAAPGDAITADQAAVSAQLIGWLMQEYAVPKANVIPHVCVKPTSCCGDLFKAFGGGAGKSCAVQRTALHQWMTSMGL